MESLELKYLTSPDANASDIKAYDPHSNEYHRDNKHFTPGREHSYLHQEIREKISLVSR